MSSAQIIDIAGGPDDGMTERDHQAAKMTFEFDSPSIEVHLLYIITAMRHRRRYRHFITRAT